MLNEIHDLSLLILIINLGKKQGFICSVARVWDILANVMLFQMVFVKELIFLASSLVLLSEYKFLIIFSGNCLVVSLKRPGHDVFNLKVQLFDSH